MTPIVAEWRSELVEEVWYYAVVNGQKTQPFPGPGGLAKALAEAQAVEQELVQADFAHDALRERLSNSSPRSAIKMTGPNGARRLSFKPADAEEFSGSYATLDQLAAEHGLEPQAPGP